MPHRSERERSERFLDTDLLLLTTFVHDVTVQLAMLAVKLIVWDSKSRSTRIVSYIGQVSDDSFLVVASISVFLAGIHDQIFSPCSCTLVLMRSAITPATKGMAFTASLLVALDGVL